MRINGSQPGEVNHIIPVSNGILTAEHCQRLGGMTPVFLFLIYLDRTTEEIAPSDGSGKLGVVNREKPLPDGEIAARFSQPKWKVRNCRRTLRREGYLRQEVTPAGPILYVNKSKKWGGGPTDNSRGVGTPAVVAPTDIGRRSDCQRSDKSYRANSTNKAAEATAASDSRNSWLAIGSNLPMGEPSFQKLFEHYYATRNGNPLSEVMERTILACQKCGVRGRHRSTKPSAVSSDKSEPRRSR